MLTLHLLGGLSLADDAAPLPGTATQRRRLALLARIAAAPNASLSRDRLIACFWPDEDRERARHHLADSVFSLRKALGKEVVRSVGDDLALDREAIRCDLWAFRSALEANALTDAVGLYQGAFADGFYVGDAPEFERWVEEERAAIAREYGDALERLADAAEKEGSHDRAAAWWRRLAALDPYSSRVALRLMQALAAAGDAAAALRHARVHATLLREELEVEPDPRVQAFAAELAAAPKPPPTPVGGPPPASTAPDPLAAAAGFVARVAAEGEPRVVADDRVPVDHATGTPSAPGDDGLEAGHIPSPPAELAPHAAVSPPGRESVGDGPSDEPSRPVVAAEAQQAPETRAAPPPPGRPRGRRPRRAVLQRFIPLLLALVVLALLVAPAVWRSAAWLGRSAASSGDGTGDGVTTIAVMPFSYSGPPDHAHLSEGLVTMLSITLNGAGRLRTLDPYAIVARARMLSREGLLQPHEAGRLASELGADLFLLGTVVGTGDRLSMSAALYRHGPQPEIVSRADVTGTHESELVDELSRLLLLEAYPEEGDRLTRLAVRTTPSLEALKAFLQGEAEFRAAHYPRAANLLRRAVDEDPDFALAHYRLSMALEWSFDFQEARRAAAEAQRLSERLAPRDQALIAAWNSFVRGDAEAAERQYQALLAEDAVDVEAWSGLGEVRLHYNASRGEPTAEAIPAFEQVLRLAPSFGEARFHLLEFAARDSNVVRFDSLLAGVDAASPQLLSWQAARAMAWEGDGELPDSLRARLDDADPVITGVAAVRAAVNFRDVAAGQELAALLLRPERPEGWRAAGRIMRAQGYLAMGDPSAAAAELDAAEALEPAWTLEIRALAGLLPGSSASRDDLLRVRAELERWDPRALNPDATFFFGTHYDAHSQLRLYLIALLSLKLGDDDQAARYQEELRVTGGSATTGELGRALALSVAAHRAWASRNAEQTLALLDEARMRAPLERIALSPFFAQAPDRFLRAEALRALGREEEARRWYGSLLDAPDLLYWRAARRAGDGR